MALTWSEIEPPSPSGHTVNDWCDLGAGVIIGVGTSGLAYRSTDGGASWSAVTLAELNTMTALAYDGTSVLIAVSSAGTNRIQRSTDGGQNWSAIAAPVVAGWTSATWDATNAVFVVVASSGAGNRTMNSSDGSTWISHAAAAAKAWSWVTANTTVVVAAAFGTSTQQIMTSTDGGVNWALQTHTSWAVGTGVVSQGSSGLAWSEDIGVFAIGAQNAAGTAYGILTSADDGVTWVFQTIPDVATNRVVALVSAPELGALIGPTVRVLGVNTVLRSTDGASWTALDPTIYRDWTASAWSADTDTFMAWDTSGHTPQQILLGSAVSFDTLSPSRGTKRGNTLVTMDGAGLDGVTTGDVLFGGTAATDVTPAADGLSLTCLTPAHAVGVVDVVITGIDTLDDAYTFVSVDRVRPNSGTTFGGTPVTVTGFGFDLATGVTFDGTTATSIVYASNTSITCVTPAHSSGAVNVVVAGVDTLTGGYTYAIAVNRLPPFPYAAPVVEGGSPSELIAGPWATWLRTVKAYVEALPGDVAAESVIGVFDPDQIPQLPFSRLTMNAPRLIGRTTSGSGDSEEITVGPTLLLRDGQLGLAGWATGYAIGDLFYADSTTTITTLADVAAGSYLRAGGVAAAPLWSTLTLPNAATTGDLLYASAANTISTLADVSAGSYLRSGGVGTAPLWSTLKVPNAATTGDLLYGSASNVASMLAIGTVSKVLTSTGTLPAWALIVNANVDAAAAIAYSKLTLTNSIVNADVNAAAAIAWTKLDKAGSSLADLTTRSAGDLSSGTLLAARMPALTGDITTTVGTVATTLATVNANVGTFGSATQVGQFTVNAKGLITAAANVTVAPTGMVTGSGTAGKLMKWSSASVATDSLLAESGTLITGAAVNLSVTGPTLASVSSGSGTAAVAVLALTGSTGGATSAGSGVVVGGVGGSFTFTGGVGGGITGTPGTGTGGAGGDMTFVGGDGGLGTTFGGRGGRIEFTAGAAGNGTGVGAPGYVKIAGGAGATVGNNDGGHVYLTGGPKNGSGLDGFILACISPSATIRGNFGVATLTPAARVAINGGLHVGGDTDPGDNNAAIDGTLVIGNATAAAQLHVETANPAAAEAFRLNIPQATTTFASTFGGITIANTDATANNYARLNFGGETGTAATATIATRITDHANRQGDLTFWNRTAAGTFTERVTILNGTGLVGIGVTAPTAVLHLKAGTTAANTAPLKFSSGSLLTTAEAGGVEFLTDAYYGTITTGAARKTFAFLESPAFTTPDLGAATGASLALTSSLGKYRNVNTAGWGVPAVQAEARSSAQTAAVASVATYTMGAADGSVVVTANVNVTTSTIHNFSVQVAYTDETNTAQTLTMPMAQLAGTLITAITNGTGAGPYEGLALTLRCKASTAITVKTAGTFTSVTYNVEGAILQIA